MSKKTWIIVVSIVVIGLLSGGLFYFYSNSAESNTETTMVPYITNHGEAQGTTYSITYQQPRGLDLQNEIDARLKSFDMSLSTYIPSSVISRINRNEANVVTDSDFEQMYRTARSVSVASDGAFDITVGPLVKAWGFAFGRHGTKKIPDVKALLKHVGYEKITLDNHRLIKPDPEMLVDANALAQGQSVDIIAGLLESHGCKNYIVEIGGEVFCKGVNSSNEKWKVGIDLPADDSLATEQPLQAVVRISEKAISTSGNYRKFFYLNGKKYAHEIDPHTGYPVTHNLLSATVVAPNCILADAYATVFMVLGKEASLKFCRKHPELACYLICSDKDGKYLVSYSDNFKKYLNQ